MCASKADNVDKQPRKMVAIWAFDSKGYGLLNVHQNEEVDEIEIVNENWTRIRNQAGDVGIVPTTYLRLWDSREETHLTASKMVSKETGGY